MTTTNAPTSTPPAGTTSTRRTAPAGTRPTGGRSAGGRSAAAGTAGDGYPAGGGYQSGWCRPGGNHTRCAGQYAGTRCTCPCHQPATTPEPDGPANTPAPPSPRRTRRPTTGPTTPTATGAPAAGPPAPPTPPARHAPPTRAVQAVQVSPAREAVPDRGAAGAGVGRVWDEAEIRALGATTDLVTAGAILGIGRTKSHELARTGAFPVPVLRHGRRYRVPVAPILRLLHLDPAGGQDERDVAIVLQGRLLPARSHARQPGAGRG